jgi:hypothetical protein
MPEGNAMGTTAGTAVGPLADSMVGIKNEATLGMGAKGGPSSRGPPEIAVGSTPGFDLGATNVLGTTDGDGGRPRRPATGAYEELGVPDGNAMGTTARTAVGQAGAKGQVGAEPGPAVWRYCRIDREAPGDGWTAVGLLGARARSAIGLVVGSASIGAMS